MKKTLILGAVAAAFLASAAPAFADQSAPPSISVLVAKKAAIAEELDVTGSFAAGEMVLVNPETEGLSITEFLAEEGDDVKKGQVLVTPQFRCRRHSDPPAAGQCRQGEGRFRPRQSAHSDRCSHQGHHRSAQGGL